MRKKTKFGIALTTIALVGCGGSGTSSFSAPTVNGQTTLGSSSGTATTAAVSPTGTSTQATETVNGSLETVTVPGGTALSAGDSIVVIPLAFPINVTPASTAAIKPRIGAGEIYVDTSDGLGLRDTGLQVVNGQIVGGGSGSSGLAFKATGALLRLVVNGPLIVQSNGGSTSGTLNINGNLEADFTNFSSVSYPTDVTYNLPANGGNLNGAKVSIGYNYPTSPIATGTLQLNWPGVNKSLTASTTQSGSVNPNQLVIVDPGGSNLNDVIPAAGITTAMLTLTSNPRSGS